MKFKPTFNIPEDPVELFEGNVTPINEVLAESGIEPAYEDVPNEKFKKYLTSRGGSLEEVARNVVNIMSRGETEASRMRAAEFIAKIHGIQVEIDEKPQAKEITINIINNNSENSKSLVQLMMPR